MAAPFGVGGPGTGGLRPVLEAAVGPRIARPLELRLSDARANAAAVFVLGETEVDVAIGGGCHIYYTGATIRLAAATDAMGRSTLTIAVPDVPAFLGAQVFAQGIVIDAGGAFANVLTTTNGLHLVIGQ